VWFAGRKAGREADAASMVVLVRAQQTVVTKVERIVISIRSPKRFLTQVVGKHLRQLLGISE